jgi:hypothetical protein
MNDNIALSFVLESNEEIAGSSTTMQVGRKLWNAQKSTRNKTPIAGRLELASVADSCVTARLANRRFVISNLSDEQFRLH